MPLGFVNSSITPLLVMCDEALAAFYETAFKQRYNFSWYISSAMQYFISKNEMQSRIVIKSKHRITQIPTPLVFYCYLE